MEKEMIYGCDVIWRGTAEVNHKLKGEFANTTMRVPAVLVVTASHKKEKVMYLWEGKWIAHSRVCFVREFEDVNGDYIDDSQPKIAESIGKYFDWCHKRYKM